MSVLVQLIRDGLEADAMNLLIGRVRNASFLGQALYILMDSRIGLQAGEDMRPNEVADVDIVRERRSRPSRRCKTASRWIWQVESWSRQRVCA